MLHTDRDYREAMAKLDKLWDCAETHEQQVELEQLAAELEDYEIRNFEIHRLSHPMTWRGKLQYWTRRALSYVFRLE